MVDAPETRTGPDWMQQYARDAGERERKVIAPFIGREPQHRPPQASSGQRTAHQGWYPNDLHLEERVLCLLLNNYYALHKMRHIIQAEDFYLVSNATLYRYLCDTVTSGPFVDGHAFRAWITALDGAQAFEDWGGWPRFASLQRDNLQYSNDVFAAEKLARRLRTLAQQRSAIDASERVLDAVDREVWQRDIAQRGVADLTAALEENQTVEPTLVDLFEDVQDRLDSVYMNGNVGVTGLATHIRTLDHFLGGFHPGQMIVLAARPKIGKSGLGFTITWNLIAHREKTPLGLISLEMSRVEVAHRVLAMAANVDHSIFVKGIDREKRPPSDADRSRIALWIAQLSELPWRIRADIREWTAIAEQARRWKEELGIELLIVDHMHNVHDRTVKDQSDYAVRTSVARGIKELAIELDIPVLALGQLNRQVEQRADKHPVLSDLRETGKIEEMADVVAFLYREGYYDPTCPTPGLVDLDVAANRSGPTGRLQLMMDLHRMQYYDISHRQED